MPVDWQSEALDQPLDPETGVFSVRLTCSSRHSVNVYMEQPCTSADGRRICIMRSAEADPRVPPFDLLAADVYSYRRTWIERDCASWLVATTPLCAYTALRPAMDCCALTAIGIMSSNAGRSFIGGSAAGVEDGLT